MLLALLALATLCLAAQAGECPSLRPPQPVRKGAPRPHFPSPCRWQSLWRSICSHRLSPFAPNPVLVEGEGKEQAARAGGEEGA